MRYEQMGVNADLFESFRLLVAWAAQCVCRGTSPLHWQNVNMARYNTRLLRPFHCAQLDNAFYVPASHEKSFRLCTNAVTSIEEVVTESSETKLPKQ